MDYAAHYDRLISRARSRVLVGYKERHHVVPRCLGGGDEPANIVALTGEEHYVAHQLLTRIHLGHSGLIYAAMKMAWQSTGNKPYGWLRRRHAMAMRNAKRMLGKHHSEEAKKKMSLARSGKPLTEAQRLARQGRKLSAEHRSHLSTVRKGMTRSPQARSNISAGMLGRVFSEVTKAKLSAARRLRVTSDATRAKMSATRTGKKVVPPTPAQREKISETLKARWANGQGRNQWSAISYKTNASITSTAMTAMVQPVESITDSKRP